MNWINIKEALPEPFVDVLIYYDGYVVVGYHRPSKDRWELNSGEIVRDGYIVYWMPFPEPPKED